MRAFGRPRRAGRAAVTLLGRRLRDGVLVMFLVVTVVFGIGHVIGDPAVAFAPEDATNEEIARIRQQLGLDRPLPVLYAEFIWNALRGDFGQSYWQQRPALQVVVERLKATAALTLAAGVLAAVTGTAAGALAGATSGSRLDRLANVVSVGCFSLPNFWLGLILIVVFAVLLRWLPTSGWYSWKSLILPIVTLATVHFGRIVQVARAAMVEEMGKAYVLVARSKGLPERMVTWKHAFRSVLATALTVSGWEYARMWGGTAFAVEVVFAWPGVGGLMIDASQRQDFPVLQAAVLVTGLFIVGINALVDLSYRAVDPRMRVAQ